MFDSFAVPGWIVQQNSWVDDPDGSDSAAYNYPLLLRIDGPLNRDALRSSLDEVVQRHTPLRSIFEVRGSALMQIVLGENACPFREIDLTRLDETEKEAAARSIAETEAELPFHLADEIPFRAVVVQLEAEVHDLLMVTHHLAYDDWSNGVLIRELSALYTAFAANQPSTLADLPVQYGDFVRWAARKMTGQELAANIAFWKEQLGESGTFHHLPPDLYGRMGASDAAPESTATTNRELAWRGKQLTGSSKRGAREKAMLPEKLIRRLASWTREQRSSIFMALLAGFESLLHRYSGDEHIAVGTCVANRPQLHLENLIGRFGNHVIIRTSMADNPSFEEVQRRVRESALTAYGYAEMPFGEVLRAVRPAEQARCDSVVQAMFVLQNAPKGAWQIPGLDIRWMPVRRASTRYDLTVWLRESEGFDITIEYNAGLFEAATIQKMLGDYRAMLEYLVAHPSARISDCPLLSSRTGQHRYRQSS